MRIDEYERMRRVESTHWRYVAMRRLIFLALAKATDEKDGWLLDLGCGTGGNLDEFGGAKSAGLDLSTEALRACAARGVLGLVQGEVSALPFRSASAQTLLCVDVLYHAGVRSPEQALMEMARVLQPGGTVVIVAPAFDWLGGSHDAVVHGGRRFTPRQLRQLVENAGLETRLLTCWLSLLLPLVWLKRRLRPPSAMPRSDLEAMPGPMLNAALLGVMAVERALLRRMSLPVGTSILCVARKP